MLDLDFIRKNPGAVKAAGLKKGIAVDVDRLLELDKKRSQLQQAIDQMRTRQNEFNRRIVKLGSADRDQAVADMKVVKNELRAKENELEKILGEYQELLLGIPNPPLPGVPEGKDESDNQIVRKVGQPRQFDFKPLDHVELGEKLDLIDIERAVKISGSRFYFLKNELVLLEFALIKHAFDLLVSEGFIPTIPPVLLKREIMVGAGYVPQGEADIYQTQDRLFLAGTAEQPLGGYWADEVIDETKLPLRLAGFSSCFRREAGSYGKDVRGILRAHQFDKVEMFSLTGRQDSQKEHEYLVKLEEKIVGGLGLPYQVVSICTGDLGLPAASKYDIETWIPSEKKYRETHSCSNCTDFQARRLNIRLKTKAGKTELVHTLNGTAIAIGRALIAIIENNQTQDGTIKIPPVLVPYLGFSEIPRGKK